MTDLNYPIEFERVIQALNETGVRYVVVGGVAVVIHGIDRLTAGLDVVIDLDPFVEFPLDFDALVKQSTRTDLGIVTARLRR